ncbi:MAG: ABC transporter permease [Eubacterium sp.]|nr:ABC transporter permease [Eubacterium sp.]
MKSFQALALKELKAQKLMAFLILIAVILSSTMTTAAGRSIGILQAMRTQQAAALNGDRYATFHQMTKEQMQQMEPDSRLSDVGSVLTVGCIRLGNSSLTLYAREYLDHALDAYPTINQVKEGRLPVSPFEIALPQNALQYFGEDIRIGCTVAIQAEISRMDGTIPPYAYTAEFTVCGILESNYIGYSTGTLNAVLGEGTAEALLPKDYMLYSVDFKTKDPARFQETVNELADELGIEDANIQYNWILLDALGISYDEAGTSDTDTGFSFMAAACILIGMLVLFAAGLVIYNILKIAVTKRIQEYGTLRAIGSTRGQIYRLVTLQLLILCGVGIPIGLLAGALSAKGILTAATSILNPDLFMADSTENLQSMIYTASSVNMAIYPVSISVTLLFAVLAAFPAARYASHVSPVAAMSGQRVQIKRRVRKAKKIRSFEAYYARLNLKRGRSRTAITILSLVMSITVFVALQSFTAMLDTGSRVKEMALGDYAITNETVGIDPQSLSEILENVFVESMDTTKLTVYTQDKDGKLPLSLDFALQTWESFQVAGINDTRLSSYIGGLSEQDQTDLLSGAACIVKNPIPFAYEGETVEATNFAFDDTITINGYSLRVAGIADGAVTINNEGFVNGVQVIVNDRVYELLTGSSGYSEAYPTLKQNADASQFETFLDRWKEENPGSHWLSYKQTDEQLEESFQKVSLLCWCLILFIGLIGILNIINTVYSNLHTRIAEIGMQRAIGMSKSSLYRTFLWEGAYYGIIASVAGGILGYICTIFVNAAKTDSFQLTAVPYASILEAAVISVAACLLATAIPLRPIAKMNIVESIETGCDG